MSNSINWGESYCCSWWGDISNQFTIDIDSKPENL
jgi:hypothetical protein